MLGKGKGYRHRLIGSVSCLLILLPVVLGFLYVHLYGVNVPYNDGWTLVLLLQEFHSGTLTVGDLFEQYNEHRLFFPRIALLILGLITSFNDVANMYLIQVCLLVTLMTLLLAFRRSVSPNLLAFLPIPFLVFALDQSWNMLQGFQLTLIFVQMFAVLALYLLHVSAYGRYRRLAFAGALTSAAIATLSSAPGLVVWLAGLLQLTLQLRSSLRNKVEHALLTVGWCLAGVAAWAVYFAGYEGTDKTSWEQTVQKPGESLEFFVSALGGSLFPQQDLVLASGLILLFLAATTLVLVYRSGRLGKCSFWVALLSFALLTAVGTAVARGMNVGDAINPKYITYLALAPVACYALLVGAVRWQREPVAFASLGVLTALIVSSIPPSYLEGVESAEEIQRKKGPTEFALATYKSQPDEVLDKPPVFRERLATGPETSRQRAAFLDRQDYSVFSQTRPEILPPRLSELSPVPAQSTAEAPEVENVEVGALYGGPGAESESGSLVTIAGRVKTSASQGEIGGVYVIVDGRPFPAFYGRTKKGMADRLGLPTYERMGFERSIPISELGSGSHRLSIITVTEDEQQYHRSAQGIGFDVDGPK